MDVVIVHFAKKTTSYLLIRRKWIWNKSVSFPFLLRFKIFDSLVYSIPKLGRSTNKLETIESKDSMLLSCSTKEYIADWLIGERVSKHHLISCVCLYIYSELLIKKVSSISSISQTSFKYIEEVFLCPRSINVASPSLRVPLAYGVCFLYFMTKKW